MRSKIPVFREGTPTEWIGLVREGNQIMAMVGPDLQDGLGGFGNHRLRAIWLMRWRGELAIRRRCFSD